MHQPMIGQVLAAQVASRTEGAAEAFLSNPAPHRASGLLLVRLGGGGGGAAAVCMPGRLFFSQGPQGSVEGSFFFTFEGPFLVRNFGMGEIDFNYEFYTLLIGTLA